MFLSKGGMVGEIFIFGNLQLSSLRDSLHKVLHREPKRKVKLILSLELDILNCFHFQKQGRYALLSKLRSSWFVPSLVSSAPRPSLTINLQ